MFARNAVVYTVFAVVACACAEHDAAPLDAPQAPIVPLPTLPSLPRLPSPELPMPDEEPYTWADFCSATTITTEIQMQRVRGPHIVPVGTLPVYDDPTDPLVHDPGHFQKDPAAQAKTALTVDWANMVQQELCNLVEALGGALDGEDDGQLAGLFQQGTFTPVFAATASPVFTYTEQTGSYLRIGPWVHARITVAWTNNDGTLNANAMAIKPPYAPLGATAWVGPLDYFDSNFGTAGTTITTAAFRLSAALGGIQVGGRATTMGSTATSLAYGDSNARKVTGSIWYKTDGTFNY
jgi:hypothetical protein